MRAPVTPPPTPPEELVGSIVEALKIRAQFSKSEVAAVARERIDLLRSVTPEFYSRGSIRRARADARQMAATIRKLETQIKRASPGFRLYMKLDAPSRGQEIPADQVGIRRLQIELNSALEECAKFVTSQPTSDPRRQMCARLAVELMHRFSKEPPTLEGNLQIARLIFEAATGERKKTEFVRACRAALHEWRLALASDKSQAKKL